MQADYIIVGQGLCGTWLSYYLQAAGKSVIVIDHSQPFTASKIASGVVNPVTGRRIVKTWMIDELISFVQEAYHSIGTSLDINCFSVKSVIDCFATPQMRLAFLDRYEKDKQFLSFPENENDWHSFLNYDFGYGIIQPAFLIDIQSLLSAQRNKLMQQHALIEEQFDYDQLITRKDTIAYKDIHAEKIIFCDGAAGFNNPFFPNLPFGLNKGEAMLVQIPGFPNTNIVKKGYSLVPWKEDIFWLGSTYLWEFENDSPTPGFYQFAENWLKQTIQLPFSILEHWASVRPATLERKPFVGMHPVHSNIGILNGMGTKGCSLAPFFANQLVNHLLNGEPIMPDADVQRFRKLLSR